MDCAGTAWTHHVLERLAAAGAEQPDAAGGQRHHRLRPKGEGV